MHVSADAAAVLVVGKVQAKERATVASAVRSAALSLGWELVDGPLTEPETAIVVGCFKGEQRWVCISPLAVAKGIRRFIVVGIEPDPRPDDSGALLVTERILLPGSDVAISDQRPCPKCTAETLSRITFDLTKGLLQEAVASTGRTKLRITSTPPGALITLDNTSAGLTDQIYSTFPGPHVVILQRDGYKVETRSVDVAENQETVVAVVLRPNEHTAAPPAPGPTPTTAEHPHVIPGVVVGVGLVAVGVGVVLQLPPDSGRQPKYLINAPGAISVVGGAAAIGIGVYLWIRASKDSVPASTPTANIVPGGGIVGWTGHF